MADYKVFGGGISAVAAIKFLLKSGQNVSWYTLGENPFGHFSGTKLNGHLFDIGMVFLEYGSLDLVRSETSKFPDVHEALVHFFSGFEKRVAKVACRCSGDLYGDYIIGDNLDILKGQSFPGRAVEKHPSMKWEDQFFEKNSYEAICKCFYPEFYHKYLKKFADKVTNSRQNQLSARYHRSAWLPLYYPDTINSIRKNNLIDYPFHRPTEHSIAHHLQIILSEIHNDKRCQLYDASLDVPIMSLIEEINSVPREQIILCCKPEKMLPEWHERLGECLIRQKLNIAFFEVVKTKELEFDCINDIDHPTVYRLFVQDMHLSGRHAIVSVEFVGDWESENFALEEINKYLHSIHLFDQISPIKTILGIYGSAFPKMGAEKILNNMSSQINKLYEGCSILGIPNGFAATSMNAQIEAAYNIGEF